MVVVGGADELAVACVHQIPDGFYFACNAVNVLLGRNSGFRGAVFDLLPVFVGSGEKEDVIALFSLVPCDRVGHDYLIGVSDVRLS